MYPLYEYFSRGWKDCLDYSDESLFDLYYNESQGRGTVKENNGYAHGKKWLNVTVAMWLEDIEKGNLFKNELYEDPDLPHWWLDMVLRA